MKYITFSLAAIMIISVPAFANESHMKEEMMKCDQNKDGSISKKEFLDSKERKFNEADNNSDGSLSSFEIDEMIKEKKERKDKHD